MGRAERFRNASLALAVGSTVLYWTAYADGRGVTAERRATQTATTTPMPLNGFRPTLRGVVVAAGSAEHAEVADPGEPRLLFIVSDTCPGSGVAVPQWVDWIRSSRNRGYSAVVVSMAGTEHLAQIVDALASRGIHAVPSQVTQVQEFTRFSGVSVTPTLLALDAGGHIRFVGGMFSQSTGRVLEEFLDSEQTALTIH